MSHQTGIKGKSKGKFSFITLFFSANDELKKFFAKCKEGKIRVAKISIQDGKLIFSK